ncbi:MAG: ribonuclease R family protein [Microcystaceae cyanobacterium]
MEFSIATLLSYFSDDKLVAGKILERKLGCEDPKNMEALQIALDALERIGLLTKERGKYRRIQSEEVVEAKLRCSSKGFCFAIQDIEDADDIYVRESHLSHAWNGDRVLVKVIKEGTRRRSPEGEVVVILERANPSLLAQVKKENDHFQAVPLDDRLLFQLNLATNGVNLEQALDHLVHVSVIRYPIADIPPIGQVTRILGSDAEEAADTDIVSCKHDLPHDFPPQVEAEVAKLPDQFEETELKNREDFRPIYTFTLDPETNESCPFIENAFTLEQIPHSDNWQIGIHIADVAHWVKPQTALDKIAKKRGTSIQLGDKLLPLLPNDLIRRCSLVEGQDRLTLSIFLTLNPKGERTEFYIYPTVIRVDQALNYHEAQKLLSEEGEKPSELTEKLKMLIFNLSPLIKAQRLQRGSFNLPSETTFPYKDEGRLGVVLTSDQLPIRALIAEVGILAEKTIAEHLNTLDVPGIYCGQAEPDWEELEDLLKLAANLGVNMEFDSEEELKPQDYARLTQSFTGTSQERILNFMLQNTLKTIKYSSHPAFHFGLAYKDAYCHCISPGQRYSDLFIERVLKLVFSEGRDRRTQKTKVGVDLHNDSCHGQINWKVLPPNIQDELLEDFALLIAHLNDREKVAEDAEKDLMGLKKAEKMKERTGKVFRGLITGVQSYGFFVEMEDLLVEGLVHVSSLKDDWYEYRPRHSCLVGRKNRIAYRLGDEVDVEVKSVDYYRQQIDLVTVGGGSIARNDDWEEE